MAKRLRQSSIESAFKLRKGDSESETQPAIDSDTDGNATDPEVIVDTEAEPMTTSQASVQDSEAEQRLNNCMMLHIHKEITDSCDMHEIAKEFVSENSERQRFFGSF